MIEIRDEHGQVTEIRISAQDFVDAGLQSPGGILLPGHPLFDGLLGTALPPGWREQGLSKFGNVAIFGFRPGSALMEPLSDAELTEYLNSGEYDARAEELTTLETKTNG